MLISRLSSTDKTKFSKDEIEGLYYHYAFQNFRIRDMLTYSEDRKEFMEDLGLEDDPRMSRIFDDFDKRKDESMSFVVYARGIDAIRRTAPPIERARFLFQVYDRDNDGHISKAELVSILSDHTNTNLVFDDSDGGKGKVLDKKGPEESNTFKADDTFIYTWLKKNIACIHKTQGDEVLTDFKKFWRLLHADCKSRPMFQYISMNMPILICEMREADALEDEIEFDNEDAESVFYASGLPEEMQSKRFV